MADQRTPQRPPQRFKPRTALNRYEVDAAKIPPGMVYAYRRFTVMGQEATEDQINFEANGWTPVPAERHPELAGLRPKPGSAIIRGGLMLMEQPAEYNKEMREVEEMEAKKQVANQIESLRLDGYRAGGRGIAVTYAPDKAVADD